LAFAIHFLCEIDETFGPIDITISNGSPIVDLELTDAKIVRVTVGLPGIVPNITTFTIPPSSTTFKSFPDLGLICPGTFLIEGD
jgi:Flp pilus assembly CpaF family ATPase